MTDLNMLCVLAGSLVGLQRTGLKKFFGAMGILPPVQIESFKRYEALLCTWLTQGFSSLHEIGTIVSVAYPPKVLDFEIMSRHCSTCARLVGVREKMMVNYMLNFSKNISSLDVKQIMMEVVVEWQELL